MAGGEAIGVEKGSGPPGHHAVPCGPAGSEAVITVVGRGLALGSSPQPAAFVFVELLVFSVPSRSRTQMRFWSNDRPCSILCGRAGCGRCACKGGESSRGRCEVWAGAPCAVHPSSLRGRALGHRDEAVVSMYQCLSGEVERFLPRVKLVFPRTGLP